MKVLYKIILTALIFCFSACGEEETRNIYDTRVDYKIDLNAWDKDLRIPGAYQQITKERADGYYIGYGGLLVVTSLEFPIAPNIYPLFAYDLACPYEHNPNIKLDVNDKIEAVCPECGSTFDIINGYGTRLSGPSSTGLQRYSVINDSRNHNIFRITR